MSHLKGESYIAQLCPTLCDRMNCSTIGLPVHHQLPEFTQTHAVAWKIQYREDPGRLQSMGLQRVGHN